MRTLVPFALALFGTALFTADASAFGRRGSGCCGGGGYGGCHGGFGGYGGGCYGGGYVGGYGGCSGGGYGGYGGGGYGYSGVSYGPITGNYMTQTYPYPSTAISGVYPSTYTYPGSYPITSGATIGGTTTTT